MMPQNGGHGGKILFIASISAHAVNYPQPQAAYNVSKAATLHLRASLAAEWTRYGIRVNSLSPGYMDTVLNEGEQLKVWRDIWASRNPMRRMGSLEEITGPVVFMCSDFAGSYVNGADLVVDGLLFFPCCSGRQADGFIRWGLGVLADGSFSRDEYTCGRPRSLGRRVRITRKIGLYGVTETIHRHD